MPDVHPTAIIEAGASLAEGVVVGPYCVVGPEVVLEAGVRLFSHVVVAGQTRIGEGSEIYPFASIGHRPQDLKFQGERSTLSIGRRNTIREYVTMNPGTAGGGLETVTGDDCLFMASTHVAHDCKVGNHVIMANNATLAGHVEVGDHAILGGLSAVHQFVRIGAHAMVGGMTGVEHDVVPYAVVVGDRARLTGPNLVGLRRRGFARAEIDALRGAYRMLFDPTVGTMGERLERISETYAGIGTVEELVRFVRQDSTRALSRPKAEDGSS